MALFPGEPARAGNWLSALCAALAVGVFGPEAAVPAAPEELVDRGVLPPFDPQTQDWVVAVAAVALAGLAVLAAYLVLRRLRDSGAPGAPAQPTATPVPQLAPVVYPQGPREDGSVVHVVGSGDTLSAIAVAYGIELSELLELNNMTYEQARLIYPGQELIVRPAPLVPGGESSGAGQTGDAVSEAGGSEGQAASGGEAVSMGPTVQPVQEFAPAPVAQAVVPVMNLDARSDGRVCTLLFDDISPNRVRESGEPLLAGGQIDLSQAGATLQSYTTDGQSEPHCFEGLAAGQYMIRLVLPASYGVTTPDSYVLNVSAGQTVEAIFGAAAGYMPPPASASGAGGLFSDESGSETDTYADSLTGLLLQYSGVIVLALAGVVLLGGIVLALVFRR
jgi:LysM repeat protein